MPERGTSLRSQTFQAGSFKHYTRPPPLMHASEDGNVLYGAGHDPLGTRRCCVIDVDLTSQQRIVPSGRGVACHQGIECFQTKKNAWKLKCAPLSSVRWEYRRYRSFNTLWSPWFMQTYCSALRVKYWLKYLHNALWGHLLVGCSCGLFLLTCVIDHIPSLSLQPAKSRVTLHLQSAHV